MMTGWREIPRERCGLDGKDIVVSVWLDEVKIYAKREYRIHSDPPDIRFMELHMGRENLIDVARTLAARFAIDGFPDWTIARCGDHLTIRAEPIDETREWILTNRRGEHRGELRLTEGMTDGLLQILADKVFDRCRLDGFAEGTLEPPAAERCEVDTSRPGHLYVRHERTNRDGTRWEGRLVMDRCNLPWLVGQLLVTSLPGQAGRHDRRREGGWDHLEVYDYADLVCVMSWRHWRQIFGGRYLLMLSRATAEKLGDELAQLAGEGP
jgi:hypothetical protein